jgi:GNAT superfamily N-acetyltransferase
MDTDSLHIRRAVRGDLPLIRRLAEEAFPATYRDILTAEQIDYMMEWMYGAESLARQWEEGHEYYLAVWGDKPVGYVSLRRESDAVAHLEKIYVLPAAQGRQVGRALFRHAVDMARRWQPQPQRLELNVNRYNRAVGFYEHLGMHRARSGDFDIGHGYWMNDYIMAMPLTPENN